MHQFSFSRISRWLLPFMVLCAGNVFGQIPTDRSGLLNAEGMGQGKYAESNGYPGPKHVLEFSDELRLTSEQRKAVQEAFNEMRTRAKELGERIVKVEEELNEAFRTGLVSEKSVRDDSEQIGKLRGRLAAVHLQAHLKTKKLLTAVQIDTYKKLRAGGQEKGGAGEHKH